MFEYDYLVNWDTDIELIMIVYIIYSFN